MYNLCDEVFPHFSLCCFACSKPLLAHFSLPLFYFFREGVLGLSFFSQHHRLSYPRSDALFLRSLIKGSLTFTRPLFT